jgi:glycosyltransferase involved in cell wall biosynthesis
MSSDEPAEWAAGLADAFTYQEDVRATRRELARTKRRAGAAEKELSQLRRSLWWRASGPIRRRSRKRAAGAPKRTIEVGAPEPGRRGPKKVHVDRPHAPQAGLPSPASALSQRICSVLSAYNVPAPALTTADFRLPAAIEAVSALISSRPEDRELAWLTFIAIAARFPRSEDMLRFHTDIQVAGAPAAIAHVLANQTDAKGSWANTAELELVSSVVVDPTSTAHRDSHTGIQRVVRETTSRWLDQRSIALMVWGGGHVFRPPTPVETWRSTDFVPKSRPKFDNGQVHPNRIRVPWRTVVVVPEPTSQLGRAQALECLADWSTNEVTAIFYDAIMYMLPETLNDSSRIGLSNFVPTIRSAKRISTISASVGIDLVHLLSAVENLGLAMPRIESNLLPIEAPTPTRAQLEADRNRLEGVPGLPIVLSVGSIEPRKNQLMTLRAAQKLWREGLQFQLLFIGWGSWQSDGIVAEVDRAREEGRPVRIIRRADEPLLWSAYSIARISVYISVAEGYGLPIAESLATGTPVITSNYGSMAEVAQHGGALTVDPRSLNEVSDAMRRLLTDDAAVEKLIGDIGRDDVRTWDDYATETWEWLVNAQSD